jgi:hypothetical protein
MPELRRSIVDGSARNKLTCLEGIYDGASFDACWVLPLGSSVKGSGDRALRLIEGRAWRGEAGSRQRGVLRSSRRS